jgi:hypothetical protein
VEKHRTLPLNYLTPVSDLAGDDDEDTELLRKMAISAKRYVESFDWCVAVTSSYFGGGVGGIFAVFLFGVVPARPEIDEWIWAVDGDLPSAYLPLEDAASPTEVFDQYIAGMRRWVAFAQSGARSMPRDVPPIDYPRTPEWADLIGKRITSLEEILGPVFRPSAA